MSFDLCSTRHCNVCLLLEEDKKLPLTKALPSTQKCSGCQLVFYCGAEHQRLDWPLHRDFCRAVQKIKTACHVSHPYLLNGVPKDATSMQQAMLQIKYLLRTALGRPLQFHEEELTSFVAYCNVCYKMRNLQHCPQCQAVSYCTYEHLRLDTERHSSQCSLLKLYYCTHKLQPAPPNLITDLHSCVPFMQDADLKVAFERATLRSLPTNPSATLEEYQLFSTAADFSCIATICYALSFVDMSYCESPSFIIFIVGTVLEQKLWFRQIHTKFFFLQYTQFSQLKLYFIGPEAVSTDRQHEDEYDFQGRRRTVIYHTYRGLLQHFTQQYNITPSLIIAFNCGFSEFVHLRTDLKAATNLPETLESLKIAALTIESTDTWSQGLTKMLENYGLPIVFTSFTKMEAEFDYAAVMHAAKNNNLATQVNHIITVKQNPYRDLRPLRNWQLLDPEGIYYRNGYVQAVVTRLEH